MINSRSSNQVIVMNRRKPFFTCVTLLILTLAFSASAQDQPLKIDYRLAMSQPSSHLFEVTMEMRLPENAQADSLDFQMAKWSPGRYAVFDFAKNVQEVRAQARQFARRPDCTLTRPSFRHASGRSNMARVVGEIHSQRDDHLQSFRERSVRNVFTT